MYNVYEVQTSQGCIWQGVAESIQDAIIKACNVYLAPESSVIRVELVRTIK